MDIEGREKTLLSEATFFRHRDEVLEVVLALCGTEWEHTWNDKWEWLQATLSLYQEQPTLLTPHLEELIVPLTSKLLRIMEELGVFDAAALVASNRYQVRGTYFVFRSLICDGSELLAATFMQFAKFCNYSAASEDTSTSSNSFHMKSIT